MDLPILLQPVLTHWFNLQASAVQKDFMIVFFLTKFLRPFVSGTNGVNGSVTKSPAIFRRHAFFHRAFVAHTAGPHHKTVGCNKLI